ncbi:NAD-dependent epimerase/dehydratase family protein [Nitrosospira briensis]|uniref:NAD-dependent epimerase/dehydratase family protein n=1 Tax=Nitrosospira briensis TaxID=35799 RepID=UPI0008F23E91|nr:NAD(P)-dependent oxidoreductase [Nitrosospira briensis]SFO39519.1 Nucleoside-diphosphate-sugar epimerase [Nitrosospira briensis]
MPESASSLKIIVTGATSIIGHYLLPRLMNAGYEVHAISRGGEKNPATTGNTLIWHQADIIHPEQLPGVKARALIHLAPLWLLPKLLPVLNTCRIKRVIGFGSTSLFSKANSPDPCERELTVRFSKAEEAIRHHCGIAQTNWTVFRPTLVYDGVRDKNIKRIASFIRRYGFFPLVGEAAGLRQPVHADDLAEACLLALEQPATFNRAYNLSGGETLTYRQMVERIFSSLGKPARFIILPPWMFRAAIRAMTFLPGKRGMTPEMATRMNADLCFKHADATRDFGFLPRPFLPHAKTCRSSPDGWK